MEYRQLIKNPKHRLVWVKVFANEIGRLSQGVGGRVDGNETMSFIKHNEIHENIWKYVMYGQVLVN